MKAYVTSCGEKTTDLCISQLHRFGWETILIAGEEEWLTKYKKFLRTAHEAGEDCVRVDADVLVNHNFNYQEVLRDIGFHRDCYMLQWQVYDFFRNDIHVGQPVFYSREALRIINENLDRISASRPETSAWRFEEINPWTTTVETIAGMHGFFQDMDTINRGMVHKIERGHITKDQQAFLIKLLAL